MIPSKFLSTIVDPSLRWLTSITNIPSDDRARVEVLVIAGQESRWEARRQIGIQEYYPQKIGARGYWQFESTWGGPVAIDEILQKTPVQIAAVCEALDIPCDKHALYEACAWNDTLACAMARLLLWPDPAPLPPLGDAQGAWDYYQRNWRPGAPHPESWVAIYKMSLDLVRGAGAQP